MVNQYPAPTEIEPLDTAFGALAAPARRRMLDMLRHGPLTAGSLHAPLGITKPAVTKHLRALEAAGMVERSRRGREHWLTLRPGPLARASAWLDDYRAFWQERLDALEALLIEDRGRG